ncbi:hypothetical protein [Nannocystis pusilla]|uniref:hypothetical protein n=1 Tax=Nannocystis pusilla TaxID=889268 RepID=UPI003B7812F2
MRLIGLLLCVSACTLDNPAFTVTATEVGSASGEASSDPTRSTTTTSAPTTGSTDPDPTGSTTDPATTANVSDSDVTTDPPATSSTTDETTTTTTTATTEPQPMTATGDTTGPVSCGLIDVIQPLLPLHLVDENETPAPDNCLAWQDKDFTGKLEATLGGFKVLDGQGCPSMNVPGEGFKFDISLPDVPSHNSECVKLRFAVHPGTCLVSFVTVTHGTMPVLTGSFGRHEFEPPFVPQYEATGTCGACPGCCEPGPDPDTYKVKLNDEPVIEGGKLMFTHESKKHLFYNVRAHVHGPECLDKQLSPADWLHFDWVVLRLGEAQQRARLNRSGASPRGSSDAPPARRPRAGGRCPPSRGAPPR